jgi:hypothetical protein
MGAKRIVTFFLYLLVMAVATTYIFLAADRIHGLDFSLNFFILTYLLLVLSFFASIILHETGHMVFGFLTGYSFLFIRFFSFAISKEEDGLRFRRFGVQGTGGQCLMIPKDGEEKPFVLYFLGGGIFNIVTALLALWAMVSIPELLGRYPFIFLGFYVTLGIGLGATNLIPMVVNGIPNDGYNVRLLLRDRRRVNAFFDIQRLTRDMFGGVRPKDMDITNLTRYDVLEESDLFRISIVSFQVLHLIDEGKLEMAMERISSISRGIWKAPETYRLDILQSEFFLHVFDRKDANEADELFLVLERYLMMKHTSDAWLALGAYYLYIRQDREAALDFLKKAKDAAATSPFRGAAEGDMVYIRKLLEEAMMEPPGVDRGNVDRDDRRIDRDDERTDKDRAWKDSDIDSPDEDSDDADRRN